MPILNNELYFSGSNNTWQFTPEEIEIYEIIV
jgi:hypothetical protein